MEAVDGAVELDRTGCCGQSSLEAEEAEAGAVEVGAAPSVAEVRAGAAEATAAEVASVASAVAATSEAAAQAIVGKSDA